MIYVFTSPLPVAVWMLFICRWRKIRQWQRAGKDLGREGANSARSRRRVDCFDPEVVPS